MSRQSAMLVSRLYYQIGILTVVTAFFWVIFGIYRALVTVPSVSVDPGLLQPLSPTINMTTVSDIAGRTQLSGTAPTLVAGIAATLSASPQPSATPSVAVATGSASRSATLSP